MYNHFFKKFISVIIIFFLLVPFSYNLTYAETIDFPYCDIEVTANAALVIDANSSFVLYEKAANKKLYPASLTKIMTFIIVMEKTEGNLDNMVNFSYNSVTKDLDRASATIGASAGDQLSVKACLYSLLLPSANDVANALAEHIAGSINDFALLMNERAESIGCTNTHFVNASGLHDDNQYTTANDMGKIIQYAMTYPMFSQISSSVSYRHAPIRRYRNPENSNNLVLNTNSIMVPGSGYYYNGITSGKTGHTSLAGYNIAASARKHDMDLICVLLGCKSEKIRYNETKTLFDFYFNNYISPKIKDIDPRFKTNTGTISIDDVDLVETLNITCNENSHITLPNNANINNIESIISYHVEDPYNKYAIGTIDYYYNNYHIGKCTIEGRNMELAESLWTSNLNLSSTPHENDAVDNTNDVNNPELQQKTLIYRNSNGRIIVSNTLITLALIIIIMVSASVIFIFLYTKVFTNSNIPINKILFRLRRIFRR